MSPDPNPAASPAGHRTVRRAWIVLGLTPLLPILLVFPGGGWLLPQSELTAEGLAKLLAGLDRAQLLARAEKAKQLEKTTATREVVGACEELTGGGA